MECKLPYVPSSVRSKEAWEDVAKFVGLHPTQVREAYIQRWCAPIQSKDWIKLVKRGDITKADIEEVKISVPEKDWDVFHAEWCEAGKQNDFCDLLNYRLKQIIQLGDKWVSDETKTYCFSGWQYLTKGKKYTIVSLAEDGVSDFKAQTTTDLRKERHWIGVHGCRSIWRRDKEIWNWHLAYQALWEEQNPNHPQTELMRKHNKKNAYRSARGWKYKAETGAES